MRIGIDVRYLSHGLLGGVHTYVANFVPSLTGLESQDEFVLYADTKRPFELSDLPAGVSVRLLPWRSALSSIYQDFFLWRYMEQDHLDVAHFPANYGFGPRGVRTVITVHDAINVLPLTEIIRGHSKKPRAIAMMTYLHVCTGLALKRADAVLTVSRHAASEIARYTGISPARIIPVPHAPTSDLQRIEDPETLADVRRRFGLRGAFVLADALKNPEVLIRAWQLLPAKLRSESNLVFYSRRPDLEPVVQAAITAGSARLLVRPSRADLIALYSLAGAFVFPSWIEGFGMPLLEAMTCGAPVVASNRGAIPEVVGDAAILLDAEDAPGFAREILRVLTFPSVAQQLREAGLARAATFSWSTSAQLIANTYRIVTERPVVVDSLR